MLFIHVRLFSYLQVSTNESTVDTNKPTYFIERHQIEVQQTCVKDLGVLINDELTFSPHINSIVHLHKACCRSILIFKSFVSRNTKTLVRAFITYVRPILEYCSPIWTPSTIKDTTAIESFKDVLLRSYLAFSIIRTMKDFKN